MDEDRREGAGRRHGDMPPGVAEDLGRLAAVAGARVSALEDIGDDLSTLTKAVDSLAASIELMATKEEVEAAEKRLDKKRTLAIVAVLGAMILLALPVAFTRSALEEIRESGDYLVECTTPSPRPEDAIDENDLVHECYEASLVRQAEAVRILEAATLDAAFCARTVPFDSSPEALEECYMERVEARTNPTPPTEGDS